MLGIDKFIFRFHVHIYIFAQRGDGFFYSFRRGDFIIVRITQFQNLMTPRPRTIEYAKLQRQLSGSLFSSLCVICPRRPSRAPSLRAVGRIPKRR